MKHAYLITAHKNFKILDLLLKVLDDRNNDFYILFDEKVKKDNNELIRYSPRYSELIILPRVLINWAGYSQINAEYLLLKAATPKQYDYYHYMQGSDFPLKTKGEIAEFFENNKGFEFVDFNPSQYEFAHYKCDYYHPFTNCRYFRSNKLLRLMNHGIAKGQKLFGLRRGKEELYHGSALFSITHDFAIYVLENESYIQKRFNKALAADEVFLQTLLMNSDFRDRVYRFEEPGANCYLIDWDRRNGNSPHTYVFEDYDKLKSSETRFLFARKFDEKTDYQIIERIYQSINDTQYQVEDK